MRTFTYQALPMRVVFGIGALRKLPDEVENLGLSRVLVLCSPEQEAMGRSVATALGERAAGVLPEARMHVPIEVARRARDVASELGADGCVAVGGGSAVGLGKAIALEHGLPVIAVPTNRPTPSCSRTRWPTTSPPSPRPSRRSPGHSAARPTRHGSCGSWPVGSAPRTRCASSA
jgi:alcohol dehydrogenase class IV